MVIVNTMILPRSLFNKLLLVITLLGVPAMMHSTAALMTWWWAMILFNSLVVADLILMLVSRIEWVELYLINSATK